jgi:predicted nuclease of predicted toxin-antitoxin system
MRLLTDQDVYSKTISFLRSAGHDVVTAAELGLSRAPDSEILRASTQAGRILVTRDLGYGPLVAADSLAAPVFILRVMSLKMLEPIHQELLRSLTEHASQNLNGAVVIVEPGRHRIRRLAASH